MVFDLYRYRSRARMPYPTVLGSGEIRLAALLPGEWGDDIKCEIFRASWLTEPKMPEYKALSYSWGLQSFRPPTILVNDCQFRVTPNLECALRHLRRPDEVVILWVDALVSQMRGIYSRAAEVIVFLGDGLDPLANGRSKLKSQAIRAEFKDDLMDDEWTERCLSKWKTTSRMGRATPLDIFCLLRLLSQGQSLSNSLRCLEKVPEPVLATIFEALRQMLTVRWWNRIWVVQEVVTAAKVTVQYGHVSAPWEMLVKIGKKQSRQLSLDYKGLSIEHDVKVLQLLSQVGDIEKFRQIWATKRRPSLLELLRDFSSRGASDDRDRIFGLLGLCDVSTRVIPDYSLTVRDAYIMAAIDSIRTSKSLSLLTGDLGRKARENLPSWVPDWGATFDEYDRRRARLNDKYSASAGVLSMIFPDMYPLDKDQQERPLWETYEHNPSGTRLQYYIARQMRDLIETLKNSGSPQDLLPSCLPGVLSIYGTLAGSRGWIDVSDACKQLTMFCHENGARDIGKISDVAAITHCSLLGSDNLWRSALEASEDTQEGLEELEKIRKKAEMLLKVYESSEPEISRNRFIWRGRLKEVLDHLEALDAAQRERKQLSNIYKVLEELREEINSNRELRQILHQWESRRIAIV
ncbi:hypothetical protein SAPIO_CDS8195 [Scedosporium apiospermum]|uniref:Heterokaryon incompatibility domain-containing protein n=1 Tax=Pseudallescheria apiosperma TaxID=563466 RepID=A0A084FZ36_PSEDA|nr:uncharacterized protein SAPIO_CDS8195 [Scedosporium apiospermum]KEZ40348.1 hypothetical protein SAPIO_CDS8195 [Scedosporium apiospermum]